MVAKPRAFCGSSSESLRVVYEIRKQLAGAATVVPWEGQIQVGEYTLDKLLTLIPTFNFGIFVFAADDTVESRGQRVLTARDNVVLELGLFMERLGKNNTFIVAQEVSPKLHLPSDLQGLTVARFKLPAELTPQSRKRNGRIPTQVLSEALAPACDQIRDVILDSGEAVKIPDALSGGMVYLLRYLERGYSARALTPAMVHFQLKKKFADLPEDERNGWAKATQYACQCLRALGLVTVYDGGTHFRITEHGRHLLGAENMEKVFGSELKRKKIRLLPTRL